MSFDLGTGDMVPLDSLVPQPSPNSQVPPAGKAEGTAVDAPPAPPAGPVVPQPAAAAEPTPPQRVARDVAKAPRLRPNRLQWRGRLASAPEVRRSQAGIDYCAVRVLHEVLNSQRQTVTQAVEVVMFRERAHDFASAFLKGDYVEVVGELRIRDWQDKSGAKHTSVSLHPSEEIALISRPHTAQR